MPGLARPRKHKDALLHRPHSCWNLASPLCFLNLEVKSLLWLSVLTKNATAGQSLGIDPFWLVVASLAYAETCWFRIPPAMSIVFGAVLGLAWYGAVGRFKR